MNSFALKNITGALYGRRCFDGQSKLPINRHPVLSLTVGNFLVDGNIHTFQGLCHVVSHIRYTHRELTKALVSGNKNTEKNELSTSSDTAQGFNLLAAKNADAQTIAAI